MSVQHTKTSRLIIIFLITLALGWTLSQLISGYSGRSVPVPPFAAGAMWIFGGSLAIWTFFAKPRLNREPGVKPFPALAAARIVVLAMAASRTGAVIAGFYAGISLASIGSSSTPAGWNAMIFAFLAALGALLLSASALWLESMCVAHNSDDGNTQ